MSPNACLIRNGPVTVSTEIRNALTISVGHLITQI